MTSGFISTATPPKRLAPPTPTNPETDVKADAKRRPPTLARPSFARMRFVRHAFFPLRREGSDLSGAKIC